MNPRTLITDENVQDQAFVTESELNTFFGAVVITGTETETNVVQTFAQYFPEQGLITVPAIVGDGLITVVSGFNTTSIGADAIVAQDSNIVVISGSDRVTVGLGNTIAVNTGNFATSLTLSGSPVLTESFLAFTHIQTSPASTWNITHNLDSQNPVVQIYDTNDVVIQPDSITANSTNLLTINFNQSVSGTASVLKVGGNVVGLQNIVEDITPQLGGNLDAQNFNITNGGTLQVTTITGASVEIGGAVSADAGSFKSISGFVEPLDFGWTTAATGTLIIEASALYPYTINNLLGVTGQGTVSGTIRINGSAVQGLNDQTWSTTQSTKVATSANSVVIGDRVSFVVSGTSNGAFAGFTMRTLRV